MIKGLVFNIQRFSVADGPGIRTTVFLKGCNLRCYWCHNPESWDPEASIEVFPERCIGCGECVRACPHGARSSVNGAISFDRSACHRCGVCAEACMADAIRTVGEEMSCDEVLQEIERDVPFFRESGGGVTISGGEPLLQPEFALALLKRCKEAGLHTCVDTSGQGSTEALRRLFPYVDLFYFDIKHLDPRIHRAETGLANEDILRNFAVVVRSGVPVVVRVPVIPGFNDTVDALSDIADFVAKRMPGGTVHLLPYHRYGQQKYAMLGLDYELKDAETPSPEFLKAARKIVESRGLKCEVAV